MAVPAETAEIMPWEKQPNESTKAFEAFAAYRDLGPGRSLAKLSQTIDKSRTWLGEWSRKWRWQERVTAYDIYRDREERIALEEHRKEMRQRQRTEGRFLQATGMEMLSSMRERGSVPVGMVLQLIEKGADLERKAVGEPTEIHQYGGEVTHKHGLTDELALDADLRRSAKMVRDALRNGLGSANGPGASGDE